MREDLSSYFRSPEFREILAQYLSMEEDGTPVYFDADQLADIAEFFAGTGKIKKSDQVVDYGLEMHPDNINLLLMKARSFASKGNLDEARALVDSIQNQEDREVKILKADLCLEENNEEEADAILTGLYNEEDSLACILDIADIYMDAGFSHKAYEWLQKAYEQDSESTMVLESLADYYYSFDDKNKAVHFYNRLLDRTPYNTVYWNQLCKAYLQMENYEEALDALEYSLAIDEEKPETLELKGLCMLQLRNLEECCEIFQKVEKLTDDKVRIRQIIVNCFLAMKKYREAIDYCDVLERDMSEFTTVEKAQLYASKATCHAYLGELATALQMVDKGLREDSEYAFLYVIRGEIFLLQHNVPEAQREFSYAEHIAFDKADTVNSIAIACTKSGYYKMALNYFDLLEDISADGFPENAYLIAYCHYMERDSEKMMEYIRKGVLNKSYTLDDLKNDTQFNCDEEFLQLIARILQETDNNTLF